jgi:heat shock protein HslJ
MNYQSALIHQLTRYTAMLVVGLVGVVATNAAMAQPPSDPAQPQQMAQASSIEGSWRLVNLTEPGSPMPMVVPKTPELTADFAGDRISGSGGCNRFNGGFETKGDRLSIGPLASTFMACEPPAMNQETKYLMALQGAQRYEVNGDGLQIFYKTDRGSGVLRFTSQAVRALW